MTEPMRVYHREKAVHALQWKGDNLKDIICLTGKNERFSDWFNSFEEYEACVRDSGNIFKLFHKGGCLEVPIGWYVFSNGWAVSSADFEKHYQVVFDD